MKLIPLTPERKAQLGEYAQRHGKDPAVALDDVLTEALAWEHENSRTVLGEPDCVGS